MGVFVVSIVTLGDTGGDSGVAGCVRSKPVLVEYSQKFDALPMTARRWWVSPLDAIGCQCQRSVYLGGSENKEEVIARLTVSRILTKPVRRRTGFYILRTGTWCCECAGCR